MLNTLPDYISVAVNAHVHRCIVHTCTKTAFVFQLKNAGRVEMMRYVSGIGRAINGSVVKI